MIVFDGQSFVEQAFLTTTGANATGEPGSLSANGNRVAVGAAGESTDATGFSSPGRPDAAPSSGAVFLFRKDGQDWKSEAFLKAPAALANAEFGFAVDLSTDHLVVAATGEPYRPSPAAPTGTVYVY